MERPMNARCLAGALVAVGSLAAAGCSNSPAAQHGTTTSTTAPTGTTADTDTVPANAGSNTTTSTTASSSGAVNQPVTDQLRAQLVAAGAALNNIPVAQYTGLAPGLTYYAYDGATQTYWAAARLVPAPTSDPSNPSQAQVASQDDGSYYLFRQPRGGSWTAYAVGASGPGTSCPTTPPAGVATVWGWPAGSCRPANA
jgi:hypothetical protein